MTIVARMAMRRSPAWTPCLGVRPNSAGPDQMCFPAIARLARTMIPTETALAIGCDTILVRRWLAAPPIETRVCPRIG